MNLKYSSFTTAKKFWLLLAITSVFKLFYISIPNLVPQEAYYWTWTRFLDWSFFDHPPLASYSIALFTKLFGGSVFWIRIPVLIYSILDAIMIYLISREFLGSEKPALLTLVVLNVVPLFVIGSVVMTPDSPMVFFWALTVLLFVRALKRKTLASWLLVGVALGFGLMSKYTAILLIPGSLIFLILSPEDRHWLKKPHPYVSVFPALIVFSPVIYWNAKNDWVSFLFQSSRRTNSMVSLRPDAFIQFFSGQAGIISPVLFCCFVFSLIYVVKTKKIFRDRRYALLFSFSIVPFTVCMLMACFSFVKMNWLAPSYITGFLLFSLLFIENREKERWKLWSKIGIGAGIIFTIGTYLFPAYPMWPIPGDTWSGWPQIGKAVSEIKQEMENNNKTFIFGNKYKISAEMWFYNKKQEQVYAQNVINQKALQFDYFPFPEKLRGQDAVFVFCDIEPFDDFDLLKRNFNKVKKNSELKVKRFGKVFRTFYIYRCYGYKKSS